MEILDYKTFALGVFCLGYGLFTLVMRFKAPDKFWKIEPMKKLWGLKRGRIIHIVGYTVFPLILGVIFLFSALVVPG